MRVTIVEPDALKSHGRDFNVRFDCRRGAPNFLLEREAQRYQLLLQQTETAKKAWEQFKSSLVFNNEPQRASYSKILLVTIMDYTNQNIMC
jgi:hypothetical protein